MLLIEMWQDLHTVYYFTPFVLKANTVIFVVVLCEFLFVCLLLRVASERVSICENIQYLELSLVIHVRNLDPL